MIDQQALTAGNYVGVTEIPGAKRRKIFKGALVILCCAPRAALSEMWGHVLPCTSSMATAPMIIMRKSAFKCDLIVLGGGLFHHLVSTFQRLGILRKWTCRSLHYSGVASYMGNYRSSTSSELVIPLSRN